MIIGGNCNHWRLAGMWLPWWWTPPPPPPGYCVPWIIVSCIDCIRCTEISSGPLVCSGGHYQCGSECPCRGRLIYLTLAPGSCWGAVWTQSLVQHCGGPSGPSSHVSWWVTHLTMCHTASKKTEGSMKFHCKLINIALKGLAKLCSLAG